MAIEPFSLHDNLMLAGPITNGYLVTATGAPAERYAAPWAFNVGRRALIE
jgi:hypothetical protein